MKHRRDNLPPLLMPVLDNEGVLATEKARHEQVAEFMRSLGDEALQSSIAN